MADIHIDIERMIMHSNYLLEVSKSSASNGLSDMERKEYLDQIKELVQTVQTLLDANVALGNKQKETEAKAIRDKAESDRNIEINPHSSGDKCRAILQWGTNALYPRHF